MFIYPDMNIVSIYNENSMKYHEYLKMILIDFASGQLLPRTPGEKRGVPFSVTVFLSRKQGGRCLVFVISMTYAKSLLDCPTVP